MRIFVEKTPVELALPKTGMTLRYLMESMEAHLFPEEKVPTTLAVDGHILTQEEFEIRQFESLKGDETIHFGTITLCDFLVNSLTIASEANQELISLMSRFSESVYSSSQTIDRQDLIDELSHFFQFWQRLNALLPDELEELMCDQRPFHFLFEHLQELNEEVIAAMDASEDVLSADILQYELVPALESMQRAIPELVEKIKKRAAIDE